jgi:proline-specific peptidase
MVDTVPAREGRIPFEGHETWFRVVGEEEEPGRIPVLCLHGGPGASWNHMEPYEALARGRRVVFYDQLGCGNSVVTEDHDPSMWTFDLYVREVDAIRAALDLPRVHILGHSWGGMLGMLYALTKPVGMASLIIQSSPASVPHWLTELDTLRAELPADVEATLRRHEAAGTTEDPEYEEAMMVFYGRHVCRVEWPAWLQRTFETLTANPEVYYTLNGPSEFHVIGPLKDFDLSDRLSEIDAPTLIFGGRYDEVTPATLERVHAGIAGSQLVIFEDASHMAQAEQPDQVLSLLGDFLEKIEKEP